MKITPVRIFDPIHLAQTGQFKKEEIPPEPGEYLHTANSLQNTITGAFTFFKYTGIIRDAMQKQGYPGLLEVFYEINGPSRDKQDPKGKKRTLLEKLSTRMMPDLKLISTFEKPEDMVTFVQSMEHKMAMNNLGRPHFNYFKIIGWIDRERTPSWFVAKELLKNAPAYTPHLPVTGEDVQKSFLLKLKDRAMDWYTAVFHGMGRGRQKLKRAQLKS